MNDLELVAALRQLKVNTKSIACMGCGHEHNCKKDGCNIIFQASDRLSDVSVSLDAIWAMRENTKGAERALLTTVLDLLGHRRPSTSKDAAAKEGAIEVKYACGYANLATLPIRSSSYVYDFERCSGCDGLAITLEGINNHGYSLVAVTQDPYGVYTVIFRRPADR